MPEDHPPKPGQSLNLQTMYKRSRIESDEGRSASIEDSWNSGTTLPEICTRGGEKVVVRKFDKGVFPLLLLIQVLTAWEKSNIGYARVFGADIDLDLDSDGWESIIIAFDFAFPAFQGIIILLAAVSPRIYFTSCMLAWGLVGALHCVTTSFAGLCFLRVIQGVCESGFSGAIFYLSTIYQREELGLRIALWTGASALMVPLGGFLSQLVIKLGEHSGMAPWRGLFLLQGLSGVLATILIWGRFPNPPQSTKFLTGREQYLENWRLGQNQMTQGELEKPQSNINLRDVLAGFLAGVLDPKNYLYGLIFFGMDLTFTSMPVFVYYGKDLTYAPMPKSLVIIVYGLNFPSGVSMLLYLPPYVVSVLVAIAVTYRSDKTQNRGFYISISTLSSALGYSFIALAGIDGWSNWVRYFGIIVASAGFYSNVSLTLTWLMNNQSSRTRQLTSLVIVQFIGQWAPSLGSRLYPTWEYPLHTKAMWVCAAVMTGVLAVTIYLQYYLLRLSEFQHCYAIVSDEEDTSGISEKPSQFKYVI